MDTMVRRCLTMGAGAALAGALLLAIGVPAESLLPFAPLFVCLAMHLVEGPRRHPLTGILLDPILAAAARALSSVTVVSNALCLRRFTPPRVTVDQASTEPVPVPNPA